MQASRWHADLEKDPGKWLNLQGSLTGAEMFASRGGVDRRRSPNMSSWEFGTTLYFLIS